MEYVIAGIIALVVILIFANVRVVPQATEFVIEFLGKYRATWEAGIHVKIPFVEKIAKRITLKEQVIDSPPQPVITKDNVTMQIDTVVFYRIYDAKLYAYGAVNPMSALENLTATTLRNIVGELELDGTLTSRDTINGKMTTILDEATDQWGIKVSRVELKNIIPPAEIQNAMEKQMKAERDRRETLLQAEGHKAAAITRAEGDKQAMILAAEGDRDARIARAEGEAKAILLAKQAEAEGIRLIREANPDGAVIELKKYDALVKMVHQTLLVGHDDDRRPQRVDALEQGHDLQRAVLGDVTKSAPEKKTAPKRDECCERFGDRAN